MDASEIILLVIIGLFAGLFGGMLGVGGSIIMIPAMTEGFGPNQHLYQAAAMIVNFFVAAPAVHRHRREGVIDTKMMARLLPFAVVAVVIGVGISELPLFSGTGEAYLRGLFGLFLLFVSAFELKRLPLSDGGPANAAADDPRALPLDEARSTTPSARRRQWRFAAAVALPTGVVAGLLGIGGGIVAVPLQRRILGIPMRAAIANSATMMIAVSLIGALTKNYAFVVENNYTLESFRLAGALIPTAILGSLIGSKWTHRLPIRYVKLAFFVLLLAAAIRFVYPVVRSLAL